MAAVLTMTIGNVIALTQKNLKRMLAYSSIGHTGYLLVGGALLREGADDDRPGDPAVSRQLRRDELGAFAVLTPYFGKNDQGLQLQDIAGLARTRPWMSFALSLFLLSMAGTADRGLRREICPLYGAVQAGETPLVVISVLCSLISVYYYLRVLVQLYIARTRIDGVGSGLPACRVRR